ncbi:MAG TPA: DUF2304 domain-containing protein [Candidatus Acidoferrum sp.]|jgi:hypothetical protein|nr:DUF2304 domain-containing protein [Candidatus Acidoferrum sp.]
MDRLLNVTTVVSALLLVIVLFSVRRAHIRVEYSVSWLVAALAMLILSREKPLLDVVRNWMGLPDSPLTLFLPAAAVALIMFFRFSIVVSHLRDDNVALAQRVAILEYHLRSLTNSPGNHES